MRIANVKIRLLANGRGETSINGIQLGGICTGVYVFSHVGEATIIRLDILAAEVEVSAEEVQVIAKEILLPEVEVKPPEPPPLNPPLGEHDWAKHNRLCPTRVDPDYECICDPEKMICLRCRQVKRVAAPVCKGNPPP